MHRILKKFKEIVIARRSRSNAVFLLMQSGLFRLRLAMMVFIILISSPSFALPNDSTQPVHIYSDAVTYNYKTGVDIYTGHVKVDQGTTHIRADKLITKKNSEHKIAEAIAYGIANRATFSTLPKEDEKEIHASAKTIMFYPILANATLEQDVKVTQGLNSFTGEIIQYDNAEQTITVPAQKNSRADIVYNPEA